MKVLCPIMVHQPSRCQSRQYIEHLIEESPNYVRNAVSKYATKCPLLEGRERVGDYVLDVDTESAKSFPHCNSSGSFVQEHSYKEGERSYDIRVCMTSR